MKSESKGLSTRKADDRCKVQSKSPQTQNPRRVDVLG